MHVETTVETPQLVTSNEQQTPISFSDAPQRNIGLNVTGSVAINSEGRASSLSVSDMNPPEIQKVMVEHIVRREAVSPHLQSPVRKELSRGSPERVPDPITKSDYDPWRSHIQLLLNDPNMPPL